MNGSEKAIKDVFIGCFIEMRITKYHMSIKIYS